MARVISYLNNKKDSQNFFATLESTVINKAFSKNIRPNDIAKIEINETAGCGLSCVITAKSPYQGGISISIRSINGAKPDRNAGVSTVEGSSSYGGGIGFILPDTEDFIYPYTFNMMVNYQITGSNYYGKQRRIQLFVRKDYNKPSDLENIFDQIYPAVTQNETRDRHSDFSANTSRL
ncbi:hypothetical protein [Pedobacter sp. NJ-S-72]